MLCPLLFIALFPASLPTHTCSHLQVLLHKVDDYLSSNSDKLVADRNSDRSVWKWLLEADKAGLQKSLDALTARAAAVDSAGCKSMSSFDGLSQLALKKLIVSCAGLIR